ncbi:hypothetical protein GE09DRAFT_1067847 [Coniochaeta sp. 2T2.1]|nr:hypothetical protein GE09DRAFT_1067847 [Coniochaeta sp. 2T2.1]
MAAADSTPLPEPSRAMSPYILSKKLISCGKYQGLGTVTYIDPRDETKTRRERDYIFLRDRDLRMPVGTLVPNIYKDQQDRWCTILVRQFRPQYETDTIEFPAGFISRTGAETAQQAAVRELEEETAKTGTVISTSPPLTSAPVLIAAQLTAVFVRARDKEGGEAGQQRLDKGEFAVELQVPLLELETRLRGFQEEEIVVDARVWMFAMGIRYTLELNIP